jgi:pSer/pThr/pTyr-binding forkhead associated (FHA) protein/tetratricopeptide (TPR) repeat protein
MNKLIIEDDEGRTTVVPVVRDEITIGRKEGNTIRLTDRNVSRRHARLLRQNGAVYIEDLASYTGVRVNGTRISERTPLRDGDQVQIGDYKLAMRAEGAAEPAAMAAPPAGVPAAAPAPAPAPAGSGTEAAGPGAGPAAALALAGAAVAQAKAAGTPAYGAPAQRARMEATPTAPLKPLVVTAEEPRPPTPVAGPPARLVVVTTELAGMEFRLDRPSLVIGRTDENDIILNHSSISRHHAKIVRDGDRYTAVDLQSANGVRVSGQEHERIDLSPGDVLELGHVKARFVGPWDNWTYDPREFAPPSRRKLKIAAAAGGLLLAGTVVLVVQGTGGKQTATASADEESAPAPAAPKPPSPDQLLTDATTAVSGENWEKAVTALDLLLVGASSDPAAASLKAQAVELKRKVDLERRSADVFASFKQAISAEELDTATARYEEIAGDSIYKERAATALAEMKRQFVVTHIALAEKARAEGRCDDSREETEKILDIDPANRKAKEIVRTCRPSHLAAAAAAPPAPPPARPPAAAAARPSAPAGARAAPAAAPARPAAPSGAGRPVALARNTPPPRPAASRAVPTTTATPEPAAAESDEPDPADLIKQARDAWLRQQCPSAIDLSRRALKARPSSNEAHQIIAVCACSLKDRDGATRSYQKLDERSRGMVRNLCARNGVDLE